MRFVGDLLLLAIGVLAVKRVNPIIMIFGDYVGRVSIL
jgi:hypothetical protein